MKICYISPHSDGTGYSHSAIAHMLALDAAGADVVARSVKMTNTSGEVPEKIRSFENKDLKNVDAVIQHNLPSEFCYKSGVLNIGTFAYETNGFPHADWKFGLKMMDKVIVSCNKQKEAVYNTCGPSIANKTIVLPHPVDTAKFQKQYELMDFDTNPNTVKFYTISEFTKRKNLSALILSYYATFDKYDDVLLIVKTHLPNRNSEETAKFFYDTCEEIRGQLGRFKDRDYYPKIALITQYLSNEHINSLHQTGDIFVSTSHAEAICLPFVDAIGFGKPCIVPSHSAFLDYQCPVDEELMVDSVDSIVFGVPGAPDGLYSCDEKWGNVSLIDLSLKMRMAYAKINELKSQEKVLARKNFVENCFSFENVGKTFKGYIDAAKARIDTKSHK